MGQLFDMDNKLFGFLSKVADLIMLNIAFLITCLPVITIGAGLASLYEVTLKMVKNEESYIIRSYFKAFKSNFKRSTIIWVGIMVIYFVLYLDFRISMVGTESWWSMLSNFVIVFAVLIWVLMGYIFPLQGKFINTCKNTLINAGFMSVRHFPITIVVTFFNSIFIACLMINAYTVVYGVLIYLVLGFATIAYINSIFLVKVFEQYYEYFNQENTEDIAESKQDIEE